MNTNYTISNYLLERLQEVGISHLFGVPGDYVLDFLDAVMASPLCWVGTCNELNAGYAADGYARMNGIAAAVVTYGVGGLSIINATAGAYAEQVPMIVISGAPPSKRREAGALVHHLVANYQLQLDLFRKVTADAVMITNPDTAPAEIDRVLTTCIQRKLPGYIEIPADMAVTPCRRPAAPLPMPKAASDPVALTRCVSTAAAFFNRSSSPILLAGVELMRHDLGAATLKLVETAEIPFATMLSSKALLPELHPQFIGIYQGAWSRDNVKRQVESSDCVISLGAWKTDLDTGMFSGNLDDRRVISACAGKVAVGGQCFENVQLNDFVEALLPALEPRSYLTSHPTQARELAPPFVARAQTPLAATRLYECIDDYLDDQMVLLVEPGDAFCAAPEFFVEEAENFIIQPYYAAIGFCTPAALGVALARSGKRPVILTGDGALQMTVQEISTLIRQHCPAIMIVVNNDGYLIERKLHEDGMYNDIQMWQYAGLPAVFGNGSDAVRGTRVTTEEELVAALDAARDTSKFHLIEAWLPGRDCSPGLDRLGATFRQQTK
ncbi:MAG TPA: hypothetical protein DCS43_08900 [Verrucomicrobia bacterium]|nr:hypothetical protein [Verrucomicrobiota bacterium]